MPKLYYFDDRVSIQTYENFARANKFNPRKSVFLFPSNTGHHTKEHSLYSRKSGGGLAGVAAELYEHEIPALGLPTTSMPSQMTLKQIEQPSDFSERCAKKAISDIWAAVGFGLDVVCPVRERRADSQYFSEALTEDNKEARLWGNIEKTPNLALGDYYHEQLKLIYSATHQDRENKKEDDDDPILSFMEANLGKIDPSFKEAYQQGKMAAKQLQPQGGIVQNHWFHDPLTWSIPETAEFAEGFKKIYTALREGQSGFNCFKTNFIAGKENMEHLAFIKEIKRHAKDAPNSRTAKALELAKRHLRENAPNRSMPQNGNLFKEIYLAAFAASRRWSCGLFKRSRVEKGRTIYKISTLETALEGKVLAVPTDMSPGSRTEKINTALSRSFLQR